MEDDRVLNAGVPVKELRGMAVNKDQLLTSYHKWYKDDIKSMVDNYLAIVKLASIEPESQAVRAVQAEQTQYELNIRAANMVRAGESLLKLIGHIKQYMILNDFPSTNELLKQKRAALFTSQHDCDNELALLRDHISNHLHILETDYYSSTYK